MTPAFFRCTAGWLAGVCLLGSLQAETPLPQPDSQSVLDSQDKTRFIRFIEDEQGAQLQTGLATYRNKDGVSVALIGAVHIADEAYYDDLNERFKKYDALLYEMVGGPIEKRIAPSAEGEAKGKDKEGESDTEAADIDGLPVNETPSAEEAAAAKRMSWLHGLHGQLQSSLELEGQLDGIDYFQPNFVHADMTHAQFQQQQEQRNEGFLALWLKAVQVQMQNPQATAKQPGLLKILEILCRQDSATELKRLVGRSFDSVESVIAGMESGEGTVILSERNKVALQVMQEQMAKGKKNLAIFYGAAHLPDMEERLLMMGFVKVSSEWLTGWDLPPEPEPEPAPVSAKPSAG